VNVENNSVRYFLLVDVETLAGPDLGVMNLPRSRLQRWGSIATKLEI
jgi:hypothetical protein